MSQTFGEWSKDRLTHFKGDWERIEWWVSNMGEVRRNAIGEWEGRVRLGERYGLLSETYESAEVAMKAVERTWRREEEMRNGKGKIAT
jgi:hypothetical protein